MDSFHLARSLDTPTTDIEYHTDRLPLNGEAHTMPLLGDLGALRGKLLTTSPLRKALVLALSADSA